MSALPPFPTSVDGHVDRTYLGPDTELRLIGDGPTLKIELQTKFNFASATMTPVQVASLVVTMHIWLMEREQAGCEESKRMLAKMKGAPNV